MYLVSMCYQWQIGHADESRVKSTHWDNNTFSLMFHFKKYHKKAEELWE